MTDLDARFEARLRADLERRAAEIEPGPAPVSLARAVRRRRRRWIAVPAAAVALVVLAATLLSAGAVRWRDELEPASSWQATSETLPAAPLAGRRDVSAVWTGTEAIVWGGIGAQYYADGAAYNPATGTWRKLAPAPLTPRGSHQAVWTGTEMIVWGGVGAPYDSHGQVLDGAAYNPATDTWRRIADAPEYGVGGRAVLSGGRMVVLGSWSATRNLSLRQTLTYDPATDRWEEQDVNLKIIDAVEVGGRLLAVGVDDASRPHLEALGGGPVIDVPFPHRVDRIGLAVDSGTLVLTVTAEDGRHTALLTAPLGPAGIPGAWSSRSLRKSVLPPTQVPTNVRGVSVQLAAGALLLAAVPDVSIIDPATGRVLLHASLSASLPAGRPCGISGATTWTGTSLFTWGGQTCSPAGGFSATGWLWTPSA